MELGDSEGDTNEDYVEVCKSVCLSVKRLFLKCEKQASSDPPHLYVNIGATDSTCMERVQ